MNLPDKEVVYLLAGLFGLLTFASVVGFVLQKKKGSSPVIVNLNARTRAWWMMCLILASATYFGFLGEILLFTLISLLALRECVTLTPTRRGDHNVLFFCFFIILPLQYILVYLRWYNSLTVLIPVYAFLLIPTMIALSGDSYKFLERSAKIQWSLIVAVYWISYVPALLNLSIPGYEHQNIKLLMFLVIVVQISDVLQYVFGKLLGKHAIAPHLSPNKTVEGFIGGIASATTVGTLLWWATPFSIWQATIISLLITLLGFAGGLCMSAIKRDCGIKDFGTIIKGHGGMMDRVDSLCFAAPVFFHLIRFWFT